MNPSQLQQFSNPISPSNLLLFHFCPSLTAVLFTSQIRNSQNTPKSDLRQRTNIRTSICQHPPLASRLHGLKRSRRSKRTVRYAFPGSTNSPPASVYAFPMSSRRRRHRDARLLIGGVIYFALYEEKECTIWALWCNLSSRLTGTATSVFLALHPLIADKRN